MEMEEAKMEIFTNPVRSYPRSNARSRYRRPVGKQGVTRSGDRGRRDSGTNKKTTPSTFKERIVFQATICGGLLAVLLFFNIIDSGFTNNVTDWIDRNISYDMLAEEGGIGGWVDSVLGIFGNDGAEEGLPYFEVYHYGAEANTAEPVFVAPPPIQANTIDSSRIDENILREINYRRP